MTSTKKNRRRFSRTGDELAGLKEEKLRVRRRYARYLKLTETFKARDAERMALLGVSMQEIEQMIRSGSLDPEGVRMFFDRVPGGAEGISKLPGELQRLAGLLKERPADTQDGAKPEKKKKRVKFNL